MARSHPTPAYVLLPVQPHAQPRLELLKLGRPKNFLPSNAEEHPANNAEAPRSCASPPGSPALLSPLSLLGDPPPSGDRQTSRSSMHAEDSRLPLAPSARLSSPDRSMLQPESQHAQQIQSRSLSQESASQPQSYPQLQPTHTLLGPESPHCANEPRQAHAHHHAAVPEQRTPLSPSEAGPPSFAPVQPGPSVYPAADDTMAGKFAYPRPRVVHVRPSSDAGTQTHAMQDAAEGGSTEATALDACGKPHSYGSPAPVPPTTQGSQASPPPAAQQRLDMTLSPPSPPHSPATPPASFLSLHHSSAFAAVSQLPAAAMGPPGGSAQAGEAGLVARLQALRAEAAAGAGAGAGVPLTQVVAPDVAQEMALAAHQPRFLSMVDVAMALDSASPSPAPGGDSPFSSASD